jgi:WD40 repeat protein
VEAFRYISYCILVPVLAMTLSACGGRTSPDAVYEVAAQGVYTGALSGHSELAVVGSLNHGASLWRTGEHARLFDWNHRQGEFSELVAAAFSPDGTRAVTTDPRTLVVWDTATGEALAFWATPGSARDVALSDDGRVLMGLTDHSAVLFDAGNGEHIHTLLHQGVVGSVALTADGRWALTGSDDNSAVLWDLNSGQPVHRLHQDNPVRVVALSAEGRYAFAASQGSRVAVYDGASGDQVMLLEERNRGVTSARFSEDERLLLVGYVNRTVELWDLGSGRRLQSWSAGSRNPWRSHGSAVLAVGFAVAGGRYFALAGDGRLLALRRS